MDPRFKSFASMLCTAVGGESGRQDMVWATVSDMAIQHWKFEKEEAQADAASPEPVKRARKGMGYIIIALNIQGSGWRRPNSCSRGNRKLDLLWSSYCRSLLR
jgi:hypothetical protein